MKRFQQFYTKNGDRLFAYLLRKSGCMHLTADLVQEAFTRYLERYQKREESTALLFTIGRNLFYDHARQGRDSELHKEDIVQVAFSDQEESYIAKEESKRIMDCLKRLGEEERDILELVVSSGLKYREIAEMRGCSVSNIKINVHRARRKLKEYLQEKNNV